MSVVCAKVYKDKIIMAADSQVTTGGHLIKITNFAKIKELNGMIIGTVGSATEASLMWQYAKTHKPDDSDEKDVLTFIVEFAKWKKDYDGDTTVNNNYLIAYGGNLFSTSGLFVDKVESFQAIGCGMYFGITALHLGKTPREAVEIACKLDCFVGEPIVEYEMPINT